ncbi:hypothetical protein Pfo_016446 [Paulownia fortunei]|nr:hypothetical protein Pfo_016446 [Paulownia fortunei]
MHVVSFPKKCNTQTIEPLEANKRKSISHPIEESGSSNVDRHWKRPKMNLKPLELRDTDIHDVTNNLRQMENFVEDVISQFNFPFFSFLLFFFFFFSNLTHVMFRLKEELFNIDGEGSQDSQGSIVGPNLLATSHSIDKKVQNETFNLARAKQMHHCIGFLVFEDEKFILNHQKSTFRNHGVIFKKG